MAQNWLVNFIDKDGKTMAIKQINCYQAYRAPAIAVAAMKKRDPEGTELIVRNTHSIKIEDA